MTNVPPINSQGIKTRLVAWIKTLVPESFEARWIDPFISAGVVAFNVAPAEALFCEANPHLVNFFNERKHGKITSGLARRCLEKEGAQLLEKGEDHYYKIREHLNRCVVFSLIHALYWCVARSKIS